MNDSTSSVSWSVTNVYKLNGREDSVSSKLGVKHTLMLPSEVSVPYNPSWLTAPFIIKLECIQCVVAYRGFVLHDTYTVHHDHS